MQEKDGGPDLKAVDEHSQTWLFFQPKSRVHFEASLSYLFISSCFHLTQNLFFLVCI